ncbi:MAG: hypothetical protein Q8N36_03890 [bacterium]|nr:hypothetical protein [bacterium]
MKIFALTAGLIAQERLLDAPLRVHSVFKRAFNIINASNRLVSFSLAGTPNFLSNIVTNLASPASFEALGIRDGDPVTMLSSVIHVGVLNIDLANVTVSLPKILSTLPRTTELTLRQNMVIFAKYARGLRNVGFGTF